MDDSGTDITAASPIEDIEQLLQNAIISESPLKSHQKSFLLGYNVESAGFDEIIRAAIREIQTLASDYSSRVVACEVSGFHGTDNGHRLWGTIECVANESREEESTRVDSPPDSSAHPSIDHS